MGLAIPRPTRLGDPRPYISCSVSLAARVKMLPLMAAALEPKLTLARDDVQPFEIGKF